MHNLTILRLNNQTGYNTGHVSSSTPQPLHQTWAGTIGGPGLRPYRDERNKVKTILSVVLVFVAFFIMIIRNVLSDFFY